MSGSYWTWEKLALVFCVGNLIYIPAAFLVQPSVGDIFRNALIPHFPPGGFTNELFFLLMANIGTTIAPWMLFFQQSSVVDKGLQEKDIKFGKWDRDRLIPDGHRGDFSDHRLRQAVARSAD